MPDPRALNGSLLQLSTPAAILAFASEHASAHHDQRLRSSASEAHASE